MPIFYTDENIQLLIREKKPLPNDYHSKMAVRSKRGHKERDLDVKGAEGGNFRLVLRQSRFNPLDFSIILSYKTPQSNQVFRLRRYNGKSHEHTNSIEKTKFYGFHIHQAIERYQQLGAREDAFATMTDRFSDYGSAVSCMLADCGFEVPVDPQLSLF